MKYSDRFKEEVVKAYADGVKVSEIMEKYDIYQDTLYRWLRENEISKRRTVYSKGFKEKVVKEYKEVGSTRALNREIRGNRTDNMQVVGGCRGSKEHKLQRSI